MVTSVSNDFTYKNKFMAKKTTMNADYDKNLKKKKKKAYTY